MIPKRPLNHTHICLHITCRWFNNLQGTTSIHFDSRIAMMFSVLKDEAPGYGYLLQEILSQDIETLSIVKGRFVLLKHFKFRNRPKFLWTMQNDHP